MYIADNRIIFVELPKTGTTHINHLLSSLVPGRQVGKHNRPSAEWLRGDYTFVGSVRNPWDWYRSLWTFGCTRTGGVYESATRPKAWRDGLRAVRRHPRFAWPSLAAAIRRRPAEWLPLYRNPVDTAAFRTWLHLMHDANYWADYDDGYFLTAINHLAGFYTYRFLSLFARDPTPLFCDRHEWTWDALKAFERRSNYASHFIRCETLESDLIETLQTFGIKLSAADIERIHGTTKTNTSLRSGITPAYYDEPSYKLVAERERLIIDRFDYSATGPTRA